MGFKDICYLINSGYFNSLKLKSYEEIRSESKYSEASALEKNLELEDLIRAADSAAETARLQLQDCESKLKAVELIRSWSNS